MDAVRAPRRHPFQEAEDVLLADQPDQLRQLAPAEGVVLAEEDLVELGLLEGVDHAAGVAHQVDVERLREVRLGALEDGGIERVGRRLVHQDALPKPILELAVHSAGGPGLLGPAPGELRRLPGGAAAHLHDGADQPLQPEGVAAGIARPALGESV